MAAHWIEDKTEEEGSGILADGATVESLTGVDLCYVDWAIDQEGCFENPDWRVTMAERLNEVG